VDLKTNYQLDYGSKGSMTRHPADPLIFDDYKRGSTGLCRNTVSNSLQNYIYDRVQAKEPRSIYIVYYDNKNKGRLTGILKVDKNAVYRNHNEASKVLDLDNIISESNK